MRLLDDTFAALLSADQGSEVDTEKARKNIYAGRISSDKIERQSRTRGSLTLKRYKPTYKECFPRDMNFAHYRSKYLPRWGVDKEADDYEKRQYHMKLDEGIDPENNSPDHKEMVRKNQEEAEVDFDVEVLDPDMEGWKARIG